MIEVPTIPNRIRISQSAIQSVIDQIVTGFRPKKIILFGSYAYGIPTPESDVDLLVIMESQNTLLEQAAEICRKIHYRFGLDLIVYTPSLLAHRLDLGDPFLKEITQRGSILYESTDS